jgi:hypothetical protein
MLQLNDPQGAVPLLMVEAKSVYSMSRTMEFMFFLKGHAFCP